MSDLHFDLIFSLYQDLGPQRMIFFNCHSSANFLARSLIFCMEVDLYLNFDLSVSLDLDLKPQRLNSANFLASTLKFYMEVDLVFP